MSTASSIKPTTAVVKLAKLVRKAIANGSVTTLAAKTGVSRNQIYRIARELNSPTLDTAQKLGKELGFKVIIEEK